MTAGIVFLTHFLLSLLIQASPSGSFFAVILELGIPVDEPLQFHHQHADL
jgi:hypothetical protein